MSPRINPPVVDKSLRLTEDQYKHDRDPKSLICLHHTVGGSAEGTIKWWNVDPVAVGTAYIVARNGTVYEVFPADCWAWQYGVNSETLERRSIGIELASEGALVAEQHDGTTMLYAFDGTSYKRRLGLANDLLSAGRVIQFENGWRGYEWFDQYDEPQIISAIKLISYLLDRFEIPSNVPAADDWLGPADKRKWYNYQGIVHHTMLRRDKSDLHPGWPLERMRYALKE